MTRISWTNETWNPVTGCDRVSPGCDNCYALTMATGIDWVIVGAESGPVARPMHPEWAEEVRDQCAAAGVALFVKQVTGPAGRAVTDLDQLPRGLQVRQWPTAAPGHLTGRSHR